MVMKSKVGDGVISGEGVGGGVVVLGDVGGGTAVSKASSRGTSVTTVPPAVVQPANNNKSVKPIKILNSRII